jgi:hypothetical protein
MRPEPRARVAGMSARSTRSTLLHQNRRCQVCPKGSNAAAATTSLYAMPARTKQVIKMRIGLLCSLAVLGLAACSRTTPAQTAPDVTTTAAPTAEASASAQQPATGTGKPAKQQTSSSHSSTQSNTQPSAPQATVTLSVAKQPSCPVHGTTDAPFSSPGTDVTIAWKVTGAAGAALAVDNPTIYGAYGMYDAAGQLSLSFPCGTTPGKTTHTYTVWPSGIKNVSKSITVSATNNP